MDKSAAIALVVDPRERVAESFPLIVHSHLRWDFVWQRPQQLLSRFAAKGPVLFVEEPVFVDDGPAEGRFVFSEPIPDLVRAVPHLPSRFSTSYDEAIAAVRTLLVRALADDGPLCGNFQSPVQWFYTPMPAPAMIGALGERGVVYDCMDELAQFRFAPPELLPRERHLLERADVVFTGGYKLYQSKARHHDNVHFFGCGVELEHFAKARRADTPVPADIRAVPHPILGYYGVIDERLDYELIGRLAATHEDWSVVMVGPVVKVDPAALPRAKNIHWLGQKAYAELPGYVKAFDVCLMPFALNEATEYINPTKTLEYMGAGKPIVSTAVADVVRNFAPIVQVGSSANEFIALTRDALQRPDPDRIAAGLARARASSWGVIVDNMWSLVARAVDIDLSGALGRAPASAAPDPQLSSRVPAGVGALAADGRTDRPSPDLRVQARS